MFLTRMRLNPGRRGTRRLVGSPQIMQATLLNCFPPGAAPASHGTSGSNVRMLWRLDPGDDGRALTLYVQSPARPDLTQLVEEAGWPASAETWQSVDCGPLHDSLATGQRWRFRVTCNPVKRTNLPGGRGPVGSVGSPRRQEEWLVDRAGRGGFSIPTTSLLDPAGEPDQLARQLQVSSRGTLRFDRAAADRRATVTLSIATFDGVLEVTDVGSFRRTLVGGIGRAKAYGCGLLTIAPME